MSRFLLIILSASLAALPAFAQSAPEGWDGERLLVLVDADMAATGYADGKLHPIPGSIDALISVDMGSGVTRPIEPSVSNTVMGWPGSMVVSADAQYAYVVTSRGGVDRSVEAFENGVFAEMPIAETLTVVDLGSNAVMSTSPVCRKPMSVDIAPGGAWLLIACGDAGNEVTVVPLRDGLPGEPRSFDLDVPSYADRDIDAGATYGMVHPDGAAAGIVLNNRAVALVRFELDDDGVPVSAKAEEPTPTDRWLAMARWTRRGGHFLVADTGWGPAPLDAAFNKNSDIVSFALSPEDDRRGVISTARVSKSPESFEFNRAGDLLAVVNMERTYLPDSLPGALFRKRKASSLSLVTVDGETGELETLGDAVEFKGVLPEDAAFDANGDRIAVVVYQDHGKPRSDGWLTFFRVEGRGDNRRAVETGERIPLPRGGHDLFAIDE